MKIESFAEQKISMNRLIEFITYIKELPFTVFKIRTVFSINNFGILMDHEESFPTPPNIRYVFVGGLKILVNNDKIDFLIPTPKKFNVDILFSDERHQAKGLFAGIYTYRKNLRYGFLFYFKEK